MARGKALFSVVFALSLLLVTIAPASAGGPAPASGDTITVGEFAAMVAARILPPGEAALPAPKAAQRLEGLGFKIGADLTSPLTAALATEFFDQVGITLHSERPQAGIGHQKASALVATFGETLSARADSLLPAAGVFGIANGRVSIPQPSLEDMTECQNKSTVKECHDCCRSLGFQGRTCGQSCSNSPRASSSEPTP